MSHESEKDRGTNCYVKTQSEKLEMETSTNNLSQIETGNL
jgi:hypothetical protein